MRFNICCVDVCVLTLELLAPELEPELELPDEDEDVEPLTVMLADPLLKYPSVATIM